jgi:hypothetical protein
MSEAAKFQQALGVEVGERLGSRFTFRKSRKELIAEVSDGHHVIVLSGSNKYFSVRRGVVLLWKELLGCPEDREKPWYLLVPLPRSAILT